MSKPIVSLCMPTNGVIEWVFPLLESIYNQQCKEELFEVVITDNGDNEQFKNKIKDYMNIHRNIVYAETDALPFINEIESYKRANGELIKFVNHRTLMVSGALQKIIEFTTNNREEKPVIYFSNGVIKELDKKVYAFKDFDHFVKNLSYWSSWSTGMTIWKTDFEKLPENVSSFNELFPHTNILFNERARGRYIIDNTIIFNELPQGKKAKGDYDLFGAFGIEYPGIICDLLRDGSITHNTYCYVVNKNLEFIASLYFCYFIRKDYCSYDLTGLKRMYGVFYSKKSLRRKVVIHLLNGCIKRVTARGE